ncbi:hypothetical protein Efla_000467 [Eimeria flavescens]
MDKGRRLLEDFRGEAAEGHRWRDQVTHAHAHFCSLTEELRALEMHFLNLQEANQLMKSELDKRRMQQRVWHQERCQQEETRHKLLAAEADAARSPILEQQMLDSKGHKEALGIAQMNEAKAVSEVAHLEASVPETCCRSIMTSNGESSVLEHVVQLCASSTTGNKSFQAASSDWMYEMRHFTERVDDNQDGIAAPSSLG